MHPHTTKSSLIAALASLALLTISCGDSVEPTEVILVIDTDLEAPTEVDSVDVSVFDAAGAEMMSSASVNIGDPRFPRTLGVVNNTLRLGPFRAVATARLGGTRVVQREARFDFIPDRTMRLRIFLTGLCSDVRCDAGQTCGEGGVCRSPDVELEPWTGSVSPLVVEDAGSDAR